MKSYQVSKQGSKRIVSKSIAVIQVCSIVLPEFLDILIKMFASLQRKLSGDPQNLKEETKEPTKILVSPSFMENKPTNDVEVDESRTTIDFDIQGLDLETKFKRQPAGSLLFSIEDHDSKQIDEEILKQRMETLLFDSNYSYHGNA